MGSLSATTVKTKIVTLPASEIRTQPSCPSQCSVPHLRRTWFRGSEQNYIWKLQLKISRRRYFSNGGVHLDQTQTMDELSLQKRETQALQRSHPSTFRTKASGPAQLKTNTGSPRQRLMSSLKYQKVTNPQYFWKNWWRV